MMSKEESVRIKLNKAQTLKFLSFFVDDAIRIANERKQEEQIHQVKEREEKVI